MELGSEGRPDDRRRYPVAWFWTDDLARTLLDAGVDRERLSPLLERPAAIAADDEAGAVRAARRLAGVEDEDVAIGAA